MIAVPTSLLLHVPPEVLLFNEVVKPVQTVVVPVIVFGAGLTVRIVVLVQPVGKV
jgi:hypothetical protein